MPRNTRLVTWNGKDLPPEFRDLPVGRYLVEAVDDEHPSASYGSLAPARVTSDRSPHAIPFVHDPRLSAGDDRRAFQDRPLGDDADV